MTTTIELIDRLEIISCVETDLFWLTAQRLRELDKQLEPISDDELLEIEALPKSLTRSSISQIAIDYFCQKNGLIVKEST